MFMLEFINRTVKVIVLSSLVLVNSSIYDKRTTKSINKIHDSINEHISTSQNNQEIYKGALTSYGPDCAGCSETGTVACFTKTRQKHSLLKDGITYEDDEYGEIRIVAADHKLFRCGTVLLVQDNKNIKFRAVVLDTGWSMRKAYRENNKVLLDLSYASQKAAAEGRTTSNNIEIKVERWGW